MFMWQMSKFEVGKNFLVISNKSYCTAFYGLTNLILMPTDNTKKKTNITSNFLNFSL